MNWISIDTLPEKRDYYLIAWGWTGYAVAEYIPFSNEWMAKDGSFFKNVHYWHPIIHPGKFIKDKTNEALTKVKGYFIEKADLTQLYDYICELAEIGFSNIESSKKHIELRIEIAKIISKIETKEVVWAKED